MNSNNRINKLKQPEPLFYSGLFIWSLYLFYELTTWNQFEDWSGPLIVMIPLIILLALRIAELFEVSAVQSITPEEEKLSLQDLTGEDDKNTSQEEKSAIDEDKNTKDKEKGAPEHVVLGSVISLSIAIYLFGFIISLPLFVFLFILYLDGWKGALVTTIIFSVAVYILFIVILDAFIWPGIFFDIQPYMPF